jgi:uncharacterized protein (TIGR03000 family)
VVVAPGQAGPKPQQKKQKQQKMNKKDQKGDKDQDDDDDKEVSISTRARLIVKVPAGAKLYIDDHLMRSASTKRVFRTPSLEAGQLYYYILRVEVERDGKTISQTKRVLVRAGQQVSASFSARKMEMVAKTQQ